MKDKIIKILNENLEISYSHERSDENFIAGKKESADKILHLFSGLYWRDFKEEKPETEQIIYVMDRFGSIQESIHQGDHQMPYWIEYEYLWSPRPSNRRKVEVILRDGKYGVLDNGIDAVPFIYNNEKDAIEEWAYFEKLNTNEQPHKRFLGVVTPIEFIEEIVSRYNTK